MLKIDIRTDLKKEAARLKRLSAKMNDQVVVRALNKTARQAKTQAGREIKDYYKIGTRVVNRHITVKTAGRGKLEAFVKAEGRPIPMLAFKARQTSEGVSVSIKGRRILIPGAFIGRMKSGHVGVFRRGGYKGNFEQTGESFGRFKFGRKRLKINELFSFNIPQGFSNKVVMDKVISRINQQFPKVLSQEIRFALSKI